MRPVASPQLHGRALAEDVSDAANRRYLEMRRSDLQLLTQVQDIDIHDVRWRAGSRVAIPDRSKNLSPTDGLSNPAREHEVQLALLACEWHRQRRCEGRRLGRV